MKKIALMKMMMILCAVVFMAASCKREDPTPEDPDTPAYRGDRIPDAVTDFDGNIYDAVKIGNQIWMAENLRTTHFANGDTIPVGTVSSSSDPYRYLPNNNDSLVTEYGYLYNWSAAMHNASASEANPSGVQGICPDGWHLPSNAEWVEMESVVAGKDMSADGWRGEHAGLLAGGEQGTWVAVNTPGAPGDYRNTDRNSSLFSVLPAGNYSDGSDRFGEIASFWSTSTFHEVMVWMRTLYADNSSVLYGPYNGRMGLSVRCVKN